MAQKPKCAVCGGTGACRACGGRFAQKNCKTCHWGKCPRCKGTGVDPVR